MVCAFIFGLLAGWVASLFTGSDRHMQSLVLYLASKLQPAKKWHELSYRDIENICIDANDTQNYNKLNKLVDTAGEIPVEQLRSLMYSMIYRGYDDIIKILGDSFPETIAKFTDEEFVDLHVKCIYIYGYFGVMFRTIHNIYLKYNTNGNMIYANVHIFTLLVQTSDSVEDRKYINILRKRTWHYNPASCYSTIYNPTPWSRIQLLGYYPHWLCLFDLI